MGLGIGLFFVIGGSGKTSPKASVTPTPAPTACTTPGPGTKGKKSFAAPPCMTVDPSKTYVATIKTTLGTIVLDLDPRIAPKTVNSFVFLARQGFYNGTIFHRVIPGFMIQGGDPQGTGGGGPGYEFANETASGKVFDKPGVVAMANAGPDTNGSQFFITVAPAPNLNGQYSIFGHVTSGQDVVDKIVNTPRDSKDKPKVNVVMQTVTIAERAG